MDSVEKQLLFREAEKFGYQLVHPVNDNPADVLVKMLSSNDQRMLEGVPVVLANMLLQDPSMNLLLVEEQLPAALKKRFRMLAVVTLLFSFWVPDSEQARTSLQKYLDSREPSLATTIEERLRKYGKVNVGDNVMLDAKRIETTFQNYVVNQFLETQVTVAKKLESERQKVLNDALSELFTDKQKELLFKMLNHAPVTKTVSVRCLLNCS